MIVKSQQNRIELVTRPDPEQSKEAYDECLARRDAIEAAWKCLNADFNECNQKIQDNRTLFELLTTMDDMDMFIKEKEKLVQDLNFRDPSHLRNKLKKHEVLAGEVKANGSEMKQIKFKVDKLREESHPDFGIVDSRFADLDSCWDKLRDSIEWKYSFIKEALNEVDITNGLEDIGGKAQVLVNELQAPVVISDVKHCNQLIAENKGLHITFKGLEQKFKSLENDASDVADGSQKKAEVMRELTECKANLEAIKPVMEDKRVHLEKALKFHEIVSALNSELQWIQEKDKVVGSGVPASAGLMQVRSLTKRHKGMEEEVAIHLKAIQDLTAKGQDFDSDDHSQRDSVDGACGQLNAATDALKNKLGARGAELEAAVKVYTIVEEMNEIESWIEVKRRSGH